LWPKPIKFTPVAYIALPGLTDGPLKVISGATVLVVPTEWPEFRLLDWGRLVERRIVVSTPATCLTPTCCAGSVSRVRDACRSASTLPSRILHEPFLNSMRIGHHRMTWSDR
jgi:hypothetical protein